MVERTSSHSPFLLLFITLQSKCHNPHFIDKEAEAQRV